MNEHLDSLAPAPLWRHFRTFCDVPRPSGHEQALAERLAQWAEQQGLRHERDEAGNLLIRKAATPGHEDAPGVVLQGHLDMVSQTAPGVAHDFRRDPIETFVEKGWLYARGTTLGADNGVGACAALAILEEPELTHGPLEVLLTVEEEASLVGALKLRENWLAGQYLLNLDSEDEGDVYIGCAGGASVRFDTTLIDAPFDGPMETLEISVTGLKGGHSGLDIHHGLGNANRLLSRLLHRLCDNGLRLSEYEGGNMGNAITREARAVAAVPKQRHDEIMALIAHYQAVYREELEGIDDGVTIEVTAGSADRALSNEDSYRLMGLMHGLPYGVAGMSRSAPGVVETSNNQGIVSLKARKFSMQLMVRSLRDSTRDELVARIATLIRLTGFEPQINEGYPGWTPAPESQLLARFRKVHERVTGEAPGVKVIHAGLECGLIGAKHPDMQMISFGPNIRGAHTPDERVEVGSVENFYAVLKAAVEELAQG